MKVLREFLEAWKTNVESAHKNRVTIFGSGKAKLIGFQPRASMLLRRCSRQCRLIHPRKLWPHRVRVPDIFEGGDSHFSSFIKRQFGQIVDCRLNLSRRTARITNPKHAHPHFGGAYTSFGSPWYYIRA